MKKRIVTGIIGGIFISLVTFVGGLLYDFVYLGITAIAIYEMYSVLNKNKFNVYSLLNYIFAFTLFLIKITDNTNIFNFILFIYISAYFLVFVFDKKINFINIASDIFIGLYIVFFMYHMMLLNDTIYVWLVYLIAFGTDTMAYFSGVTFGKHKMCPTISPNKTIEGAVGGVIGCTVFVLIYFYFLGINSYINVIALSVFSSIISMIGDLTASKIKREYNIKDFGKMLPGHGGILDRFDSLLFVAPIVFYFTKYFI